MSKRLGLFITVGIAVIAVVVFFALHHKQKPVSGQIKTITTPIQQGKSQSPTNNLQGNDTVSSDKVPSPPLSSSANTGSLVAPYGSLVSNHKPGQNGSNLLELSQCSTTPGATCYIKFTQNDVVRTLPTKTADSSGTAYWEWSISDAGLTSGKWTITAVASLNNQTKSTNDQLELEVQ